ncbi:MAG TPA: YdcH family protein [Azospirillum sp.]|nr:YdcH family protein [Azospirillum sp.]
MSLESRLASLRNRHAALDDKIRLEQARVLPDTQALARMKLDKLHVKEEIERLAKA